MNVPLTGQVEHLVMERTGLKLRPRQHDSLATKVASRISALSLRDEEEYCRFLSDGGPIAQVEWQRIARQLTNKESYFFRDRGQMALLRDVILPELIDRNQSTQSLRIWSAGCSTGEEAYTLAILVDELLPKSKMPDWKITVIGSDIDDHALQVARRGVFGKWSFRMVDPATKRRYFRDLNEGLQVLEPYHSSVVFTPCNLVADTFPSSLTGICEMDLILCRNVFIYFERKAVAAVVEKFSKTLRPGGFLMTGHVETQGLTAIPFTTRNFPESEIYQKCERASKSSAKDIQTCPSPVRLESRRTPNVIRKPESLTFAAFNAPNPHLGLEQEKSLLLVAWNFANLGQYGEAVECCQGLVREFPFSPRPYELLASIAQEQGRDDEAKALIKKALYLAPESPQLYLELGALYHGEGDAERAQKMRLTALELLESMPPEAIVGSSGGPNVRECIRHLTDLNAEGA